MASLPIAAVPAATPAMPETSVMTSAMTGVLEVVTAAAVPALPTLAVSLPPPPPPASIAAPRVPSGAAAALPAVAGAGAAVPSTLLPPPPPITSLPPPPAPAAGASVKRWVEKWDASARQRYYVGYSAGGSAVTSQWAMPPSFAAQGGEAYASTWDIDWDDAKVRVSLPRLRIGTWRHDDAIASHCLRRPHQCTSTWSAATARPPCRRHTMGCCREFAVPAAATHAHAGARRSHARRAPRRIDFWKKKHDSKYNHDYYVNSLTGEKSWTPVAGWPRPLPPHPPPAV